MKLNNTQINALAQSFRNELIENREEKINKLREEKLKSFKTDFDKAQDILKRYSFLTEVSYYLNGKNYEVTVKRTNTFKSFSESWTVNNFLRDIIKSKIPDLNTIKNEIILSTIDASSVEDIMKNLKKKFK